MVSETSNISQNQAMEERLSNMHEQLAGATSRLDQTERALDLECATREDIIRAEVERRMAEAEKRIREEVESEFADGKAIGRAKGYRPIVLRTSPNSYGVTAMPRSQRVL